MAHLASALSAAAAAPPCCGEPLFCCEGRSTAAPEAAARVGALATALTQRLALQPGDRVALAALTTDHYLEAFLAAAAAGCITAPLNWRWSPGEAAHAARLVEPALLIADAPCLPFALRLAAGGGGLRALLLLGDPAGYAPAALAAAPPRLPLAFVEALIRECPAPRGVPLALRSAPGGAAALLFTSGTTGAAKGVVLSHAALHSQSMAKLLMCGYSSADVYLHAAPLFHVGGLSSALAMLLAGARHVFLPRFEAHAALAAIQQHAVTAFIAVPTMVADLVAAAESQGLPFLPGVRRVLVGGGGMAPGLAAALGALCPGASVHSAYGMTEGASSLTFHLLWGPGGGPSTNGGAASPHSSSSSSIRSSTDAGAAPSHSIGGSSSIGGSGSINAAAAAAAAAGTSGGGGSGVYVGAPPPGIELGIIYLPPSCGATSNSGASSSSGGPPGIAGLGSVSSPGVSGAGTRGGIPAASGPGRVVGAGRGEVVSRGPHTMLGYWEDEAATAAALLPGGWVRTGDLGQLAGGRLWLLGRAKDMIKSGGENVHAWEVERTLAAHPGVAAAAVVGVSDWRLGEAVAAAVVLAPGWAWRGEPCQLLLAPRGGGSRGGAQRSAEALLAAAAAAVGGGGGRSGRGGMASAAAAAAAAAAVEEGGEGEGGPPRSAFCAEDLRSTLLQRPPSRPPGSAQAVRGGSGGLGGEGALAEVALPGGEAGPCSRRKQQQQQQQRRRGDAEGEEEGDEEGAGGVGAAGGRAARRQLLHLAAELEQLALAAANSSGSSGGGTCALLAINTPSNSSSRSSPSSGGGGTCGSGGGADAAAAAGPQSLDGRALQAHCRAAGLAGFKLPRVFLLCPPSGRGALPLNSTGKVVKHSLHQLLQAAVEGAAAGGQRGGGGGAADPRARL